jgi:hypothetical protein
MLKIMVRSIPLLAAVVLLSACAKPAATSRTEAVADELTATTIAAPSSTTPGPSVTSTTSTPATTLPEGRALVADAASVFGLPSGTPIERPDDFPTLGELEAVPAHSSEPHPRARILSGFSLVGSGSDPGHEQESMTITYFDGVIVWDYSDGTRELTVDEGGSHRYRYQYIEPGFWVDVGRVEVEWPETGPVLEWTHFDIPLNALSEGWEVVGYELIADTPTVRVRAGDDTATAELWLDKTRATLRAVVAELKENGEWSVWVWDVESLSPELTGPLPPDLPGL